MNLNNRNKPKLGIKKFGMSVTPDMDQLQAAIAANGQCQPKDCWHKVAIAAILASWSATSQELASIRVDAGHIKLNFQGWRYVSDTPMHVKRSLMLFDVRRYSEVRIREYILRFRRTTKIQPQTVTRLKQIKMNNRTWRAANPGYNPPPASLRKRVEGFSSIV
jgi:hypothetical protein